MTTDPAFDASVPFVEVAFSVNGAPVNAAVEPRVLLVHFLRETLGLTGTNIGCDTSSCGACTVLVDGESVKSCTMLAVQAEGTSVTTIEGLNPGDELHVVQQNLRAHHGVQCGYCTPGMVLAIVSLLNELPDATEDEIRHGLEGNLCRCTGYHGIVEAALASVRSASEEGGQGESSK